MRSTRTRKLAALTLLSTTLALASFSCDWLFGRRPVRRLQPIGEVTLRTAPDISTMPAVVQAFVNT